MTTKLYVYPESLLKEPEYRPIVLIDAQFSTLSNVEKAEKFGAAFTEFTLVENIRDADVAVMPYHLHFCFSHDLIGLMLKLAEDANRHGKKLLVWATSDQCLAPRYHQPGLMTLAEMGFQSCRSMDEFCAPWFAPDPLDLYFSGELPVRQKGVKPVVGFCGQALLSPSRLAWQTFLNVRRTLSSWLNLTPFTRSHILPGIVVRAQALKFLEKDTRIETNFIRRKSYKAGLRKQKAQREDPYHATRLEFINTIFNTDYTVCVRGGGNWSMRLYEALSCGRIPVFVDTDCILPFDFLINWRNYVVWIEQHEIPYIAEKVVDFHASLSPADFIERQYACRNLWVSYLSKDGFFSHFHEHLRAPVEIH